MEQTLITDSLRPIARPAHHKTSQTAKKRAAVEAVPLPERKMSKAIHQPASPHKPSSILQNLFHSQDSTIAKELIDLTFDSDDEEDTSQRSPCSTLDGDTPESSRGTDRSSQASDLVALFSPEPPKRPTLKVKQVPSWCLFGQEDALDDHAPEHTFLPILAHQKLQQAVAELPKAGEKLAPVVEEEEPRASEQLRKGGKKLPDHNITSTCATPANISSPTPRPSGPRYAPYVVVEGHMRIRILQKQKDGRLAVPWGVQFYLASLASLDYVSLDELNPAKGTDVLRSNSNLASICALFDPLNQHLLWDAGKDTTLVARCVTDRERQVYKELDRENEIRTDSCLNGVIGPPGEEMRSFGGRVLFEGRLICAQGEAKTHGSNNSQHRRISIQLFPPKLGASCRFSRRFGSESILRLKMDPGMAKDAKRFPNHPKHREVQQEILHLFQRPIQILGRYYRPFYCKDETIFCLWIGSVSICSDRPEIACIWDLVDHHAPFDTNGHMKLGKFIQRVQLGLSTSVPACVIDTITHVPDTFSDPDPESGMRQEMTDGAGVASLAVFKDVADHLRYDSIPSAFQGRIAGAKGVWVLDPEAAHALPNEEAVRWIQIRDSQKKLNYPQNKPLDLSQTIVDLVVRSRTFAPSTLSRQIILVLQSNGVPISTFADMQRAKLQAIVEEISWGCDTDTDRMRLAAAVERLCKVESMKAKRSTESAEHRAQGMESHVSSTGRDPNMGDDDREIFFGSNGRHLWNGMPVSKHERAYELLLHGFHPSRCVYLADLLIEVADMAMRRLIKKFAIPVARSAEAIVIPDPTGVLEEDEIQFNFSGDGVLDPDTGLTCSHVPEGEVLVTRHPCLLPTDIRKVRAVYRRQLSLYNDVVVFSTKGKRPLASLLSGGDYDGDLVRVFWEPRLVEPFENADMRFADCPFEIEDVFDRSNKTVAEFVAEHVNKREEERDCALIKELVAGAFQPAVQGLYGAMHLYAAWQFGTNSTEAVDLAHKFCQCMDSAKTGLSIQPWVRINDSKNFLGDLPEWSQDAADESDPKDWFALNDRSRIKTAIKGQTLPESVLCRLWDEGKVEMGHLQARLHDQVDKLRGVEDKDITQAWNQAKSLGRISRDEEKALRTHVSVLEASYAQTNARTRQEIEMRSRQARNGTATAKSKKAERQLRSVPLRRVRSEAAGAVHQPLSGLSSVDERAAGSSNGTVDDLNSDSLLRRLEGTIEVPVTLGSASEVAARFCQWPKAFSKHHMSKMDDMEIERLEKLRASYAYAVTYKQKPRFAFEMAWCWILCLKAKATGKQGALLVPTSTLDLLALRTKIIKRNFEMSQGKGVEI